jgi:hypothetical protein
MVSNRKFVSFRFRNWAGVKCTPAAWTVVGIEVAGCGASPYCRRGPTVFAYAHEDYALSVLACGHLEELSPRHMV